MTTKMLRRSLLPLSLCATSVAWGQATGNPASPSDAPITPVKLDKSDPDLNRVNVSFQWGWNMSARFKNIGSFAPQSNPGAATGLSNHTYDDGYNLVDSAGNEHFNGVDFTEGTWFWGFSSFANQVHNNGDVNGTIDMHSDSSKGGAASRDDDPQPGFEIMFSRELYRDEHWRWGLEGGFNYVALDIHDNHPLSVPVTRITDTYSLLGNSVPEQDNYSQDQFGNPNGIIIGDSPSRSISNFNEPVTGKRDFGADVFGFKFGPYVDIPLCDTFTLTFDGGVTLVYVYSVFSFNEFITTESGPVHLVGKGAHDDILFGGYLGGNISMALNDHWTAFAGVHVQDVGTYTHRSHTTGQAVVLDLSQSVFLNFGVGCSF